MRDNLVKLWTGKGTITMVLCAAVFAWIFNVDWSKKSTFQQEVTPKTIEEIIATNVDHSSELVWDTEFKSAIEAVK